MSKTICHLFVHFAMLWISVVNLYAQSSLSSGVSEIMESKASNEQKLAQLYSLKKKAENNRQTKDSGYAITLLNIANYERGRDIQLALSLCVAAIQCTKQFPASQSLTLRSYYNTATFLFYTSQFDRAIRYYDTVIELTSAHDPGGYILDALYYRTYMNYLLGDYETMTNGCKMGIEHSIASRDTSYHSLFLYFSAYSLLMQEQIEAASEQADECIRLSAIKKDTGQLADAYSVKAGIYAKQKNYHLAEEFYKKALQYRTGSFSNYSNIVLYYNNFGIFYLEELHDYKKADACFRNAIRYSAKCRIEERPRRLFISLCNTGDLYVLLKQPFKAIQYYSMALANVNVDVKDFLNSNPEMKQLNLISNKDALLSILTSKCGLLLDLYKTTSKKNYLQNCIRTSILADSLVTQMRHEQLGEKSKLYWRNKTRTLFSIALEACYTSGNIDSAIYFMEKSRSVLLSDKLNELTSNAFYLPKEDIDREMDLQRKIITLENEFETLSPHSAQYTKTEMQLLQTREDLERYIKSIEKNYPSYFQFKYAEDVPSLPKLKEYLTKNRQSFVYYFVNDSAIYALAISKEKNVFIKILPSDLNSRQLFSFIQLCSNKQAVNSQYDLFSSLAQTIYNKLFQPLHISPGKVAVCTDNFFIPFEALCTDNKGKHFLINDYSFSYVYSARSLLNPFVCNNKPIGDFAGFAPVSFSSSLGVFSLANSSEALQNTSQYYSSQTLFTKQQATRQNFLSQASKYSVVTIFSHAQADTTGKEPVLYMQDSLIRLSELQTLSNSAIRFVLLSACQTNIGKNATGEGIYSLARGFAVAGVPSVSATLWKADEEATYNISAKFNEYLSKGMNKSEALQQAKIWYLQSSDRAHTLPYYWANMVLIGTDDPISFKQPNYNWLWLAIASLAAVLAASFFVFRYKKKTRLKPEPRGKIFLN